MRISDWSSDVCSSDLVIMKLRGFLASDQDRTLKASLQKSDGLKESGLSRTGRTQERADFTRCDSKINAAQNFYSLVALDETTTTARELDNFIPSTDTGQDRYSRPCRAGRRGV